MSHATDGNFTRHLDFIKMFESISCSGFPAMYLTTWFLHIFSLPWQGLQAVTKKQKYDKICKKKLSTPIEVCSSVIFYFYLYWFSSFFFVISQRLQMFLNPLGKRIIHLAMCVCLWFKGILHMVGIKHRFYR